MFSRGSEGIERLRQAATRSRIAHRRAERQSVATAENGRPGSAADGAVSRSVALRPGVDLAGDGEAQAPAGLLQRARVGPGMETTRAHDAAVRLLLQRAGLSVAGLAQGAHGPEGNAPPRGIPTDYPESPTSARISGVIALARAIRA